MSMWPLFLIFCATRFVEGYQDATGKWLQCPEGYTYNNEKCHPTKMCQDGYFLHSDGLCYRIKPEPCPLDTSTTVAPTEEPIGSTNTEAPTVATEPKPGRETPEDHSTTAQPSRNAPSPIPEPIEVPDEIVRCPPGSIYFQNQCRKIRCSQGEYYAGRCLFTACPLGTVWRGKRCQPPGYITTILEIDNVIKNTHEFHAVTENFSKVEYVTMNPYDPNRDSSNTQTPPPAQIVMSTTTQVYSPESPKIGCCTVKSPRICRPYPPKWVCFNRSQKLCDPRICTSSVIYLKPPEIVELSDPPMLVMPPNPPLSSCLTADCKESEMLNCSGCSQGQRENCSASCYNYYCPGNSCEFKKSEDFCALYPGGFGCNKNDGCIWNWC